MNLKRVLRRRKQSLEKRLAGWQALLISVYSGRSSNMKHLINYIKLSIKLNDVDNFLYGLVHEIECK